MESFKPLYVLTPDYYQMITLDEIRALHQLTLDFDRETDPNDYAPGERYIAILEIMLEYKLRDDNDIFLNSTIALQTIAAQHPFVNGNKRTATLVAMEILADEGYELQLEENDYLFIVAIATPEKEVTLEEIVEWIKKKVIKIDQEQ